MPFRRKTTSRNEGQKNKLGNSESSLSIEDANAQSAHSMAVPGNRTDPNDYEVGFGKPPKDTQFKKGKSGNPNGRPKGAKGLNSIVKLHLLERVAVRTGKGTKRIARIEALVLKLLEAAGTGDQRALTKLLSMYAAAVPDTTPESTGSGTRRFTETDHEIIARFLGAGLPTEEDDQ